MHNGALKHSLLSSSALALAGLGDSFLYIFLPASYQTLGFSVFWVGILLSVNRFTRLVLNSYVAYSLSKFGLKNIAVATTIVATLTTLSYGFLNSITLWVIARILWGISFSTLRLSNLIYALQHSKKGISLGLSKSITEIGSLLALIVGPVLILHYNRSITFSLLTVLSAIGIFIALSLPALETKALTKKDLYLSFPSTLNILVLLNTFVVEGMMVVLAGHLLLYELELPPSKVLIVTGFYLAYRRACLIFFSPLSGWLADIWGFRSLFNYTSLLLVVGIALVAFGFIIPGLIISFTFSAMNASVAPGGALTNENSLVKDISDNATWRDIGAAGGTLAGSLLLNFLYLHFIFMVLLIPIITVLIIQFINSKKQNELKWN